MPVPSFQSAVYFSLLACCVLLGGGLLAGAWRRPRQRQRGARLLASAVAAGALWLAAFPPLRHLPAARAEAILLTDDYSPDTLRQLLRRLGRGTPVWHYGRGPAPARARPLASPLTLAEQTPGLRRLHVLGRGLAAAELPELGNVPVQLHGGRAFVGFRTALWNARPALGEELRVEGTVELPKGGAPAWVGLRAAGTVRDSVRVPASGGGFRLRYQPKTTGLALYELVLRRAGRPLATEPVPVEILTPPRPAVLLLTAAPSFEFKFLQTHLAAAHYPVALRTAISRGLVQTDFANQPAGALDQLTPALLARYGVLVADAASLGSLSGAETQALRTAIRAGRLGLLVLAGTGPLPRATPAGAAFTVLPRATTEATPQALAWPGAPAETRALLPAQLRPGAALRTLVTGPGRALVAASRREGLGFVVVSVVPGTFPWVLQGHAPAYAAFWNRLLTAAVPPAAAAAAWREGTRWPRPRQPLTLHLAAAFPGELPTVRALAGGPAVRLALRQDPRLPEWSTAQLWPTAAGWHAVRGPGPAVHQFYVFPDSAWQGPEGQERQLAMAQRAASTPGAAASEAAAATGAEPWPAGWFFGLFLLAAGYLWLEEKL